MNGVCRLLGIIGAIGGWHERNDQNQNHRPAVRGRYAIHTDDLRPPRGGISLLDTRPNGRSRDVRTMDRGPH